MTIRTWKLYAMVAYTSQKVWSNAWALKVKKGDGRLRFLQQAVRTIWLQKDLEDMAAQLNAYQNQLELGIFVSFRRVSVAVGSESTLNFENIFRFQRKILHLAHLDMSPGVVLCMLVRFFSTRNNVASST
jgi:hypothetical protein